MSINREPCNEKSIKEKEGFYDAFISYRHLEPDQTIAQKLQGIIEKQKKNKQKKLKVFLDKSELTTSASLDEEIQKALRQTEYLIILCSERYLESKYCLEEVRYFLSLSSENRRKIIPVLVEGEPRDVFPEEIRFIHKEMTDQDENVITIRQEVEPLAADVRADRIGKMLRRLKNTECYRILAVILGMRYDELYQRETKRQRKRRSLFAAGALTVFGIILSIIAINYKRENELRLSYAYDMTLQSLKGGRDVAESGVSMLPNLFQIRNNYPRAAEHYEEQIQVCEKLIFKNAYVPQGGVVWKNRNVTSSRRGRLSGGTIFNAIVARYSSEGNYLLEYRENERTLVALDEVRYQIQKECPVTEEDLLIDFYYLEDQALFLMLYDTYVEVRRENDTVEKIGYPADYHLFGKNYHAYLPKDNTLVMAVAEGQHMKTDRNYKLIEINLNDGLVREVEAGSDVSYYGGFIEYVREDNREYKSEYDAVENKTAYSLKNGQKLVVYDNQICLYDPKYPGERCLVEGVNVELNDINQQKGRIYITKGIADYEYSGEEYTLESTFLSEKEDAPPEDWKEKRSIWMTQYTVETEHFLAKKEEDNAVSLLNKEDGKVQIYTVENGCLDGFTIDEKENALLVCQHQYVSLDDETINQQIVRVRADTWEKELLIEHAYIGMNDMWISNSGTIQMIGERYNTVRCMEANPSNGSVVMRFDETPADIYSVNVDVRYFADDTFDEICMVGFPMDDDNSIFRVYDRNDGQIIRSESRFVTWDDTSRDRLKENMVYSVVPDYGIVLSWKDTGEMVGSIRMKRTEDVLREAEAFLNDLA